MQLYGKYLSMQLKSQLEYRKSFAMMITGQALGALTSFVAIMVLFTRFHSVNGFTLPEVLISFVISWSAYSLAETFARGFDRFSVMMANGSFDRILLRPRNEILQILGQTIEFSRLGRLLQSLIVLTWVIATSPIEWTFLRALTVFNMTLGGVFVFSGLFLIGAGITFFTTEGLEVLNVFTDGGREFGVYPMSVYGTEILRFFTFVVPIAVFQTYPLRYLFYSDAPVWLAFLPLLTVLFYLPAYAVWRFGRRHYASTGS